MRRGKSEPVLERAFELVEHYPEGRAWRLLGSTWHDPGDGWLTAHDLFHHEPEDTGSLEGELRSFGVQHWLETRGAQVPLDDWAENSFSTGLAFVFRASLDRLALPEPPPVPATVPAALLEVWHRGCAEATQDLQTEIEEGNAASSEGGEPPLRTRVWEQAHVISGVLDEPDYADRLVGWVAEGWRQAGLRYPDPAPV